MVEAISDSKRELLCSVAGSSHSVGAILLRNCDTASAWDDLVDMYSGKVQNDEQPQSSSSNRKRKNNDRVEDLAAKLRNVDESKPSTSFVKANQITCPVCEHVISSNALRAGDIVGRKFIRHLRKHDGELDNPLKAPCTICFHFYRISKMDEHYKQEHGDVAEDFGSGTVISFTNSTRRYQSLVDSISASLKSSHPSEDTCSRIPESSRFNGSTRMGLVKARESCRQKFISVSDQNALFRFKYRHTSSLPFAWLCPLCEESAATARCSSFHNDISLRMFVLRHFAIEHHDLEGLVPILQQEWAILSYEIGFDLEFHVIDTARLLRQCQRSAFFYTLRGLKTSHQDALVHEMMGRSTAKEDVCSEECAPKSFAYVLKKSLSRHLSTAGHEWLNAHNEPSEFREVAEFVDPLTITAENFPSAYLCFSKCFRIKEFDAGESITFWKWQCLLTGNSSEHSDEVIEFPSKELLKVYALKHFESCHKDFFDTEFFRYERSILQEELPCAPELYSYSPLKCSFNGEPFDTANPNHFDISFRTKFMPRSCSDVRVCGFCFWCGYGAQFLAHIASHGYVEHGIALVDAPGLSFPISLLSTDPENIDSERMGIPNELLGSRMGIPNELLGSVGLEALRQLSGDIDVSNGSQNDSQPTINSSELPSTVSNTEPSVVRNPSHPAEIFVPRSECSSRSNSAMDHSLADCTEDTIRDGDFHNGSDGEDLPLFKSLVTPKGESSDKRNIVLMSEGKPESISAMDEYSSASNASEQDVEPGETTTESDETRDHKERIWRKYLWEGPPPSPLDAVQTSQLVCLSRNECPFCNTASGSRGLRVPSFANDEIKEECMIAHIVKFHHKDPDSRWVLDAKRYRMSGDERRIPLKFMLEPTTEGCLRCSSCERAAFDRLANLRVHWNACVGVCGRYRKELREGRPVLESPLNLRTPKRRSKNEAVKCPLPKCASAWRPSFKYPNSVTQIAHIISRHVDDKEAYDVAMKLAQTEKLLEEFPFLDVAKSFAKSSATENLLWLQCAKCDRGFHSPYELVQHAKRYHPTEEHYSGAPKCPFGCKKRLQRLRSTVSDNVLRLLHVMIVHLPQEDAVSWVRKWISRFDSEMENEPLFKFDVIQSLNTTVETGQCHIFCSWCSTMIEGSKYYAHRRRGSGCYGRPGEVSEQALDLIEKSKSRVARVKEAVPPPVPAKTKSPKTRKHNSTSCKICSKNIIMSDKYSEAVSTFLHVLHIHLADQDAQNSLIREYSTQCAMEFPYIDVKASVEVTASTGKPSLQCVICAFRTDTSRRISMHARHHEDLMHDLGYYPDPCSCGQQIRVCGAVKESFQRLCHVLERHSADEDQMREAIAAFEIDYAVEDQILDRRRSLELSVDGETTFACPRCDFSCHNSYALIHHSKIHETTVPNNDKTEKKETPRKNESPIVCTICNRLLLRSSRYSARVTILAHFVKFHRNSPKEVEKFLASGSWDVAGEFPFIDAVTSIKRGKLQCALCEAAFADTCPLLKHATCVHEGHQKKCTEDNGGDESKPNVEVGESSTKPTQRKSVISLNPGEELRDWITRISSQAIPNEDKPLSRCSSRASKRASPIDKPEAPSDDENEDDQYNSLEINESEENTRCGAETPEPSGSQNDQEKPAKDSEPGEVASSGKEVGSKAPSTPQPPEGGVSVSSVTGQLLSWLSKSSGTVIPPVQAQLLPHLQAELAKKQQGSVEANLRDILGNTSPGGAAGARSTTPKPLGRTLFDELPQRIVKDMKKQQIRPPTDISHIEGAKGYPCNFCEFKGRTVNDIRRHTSTAHSEFFPSMSTKIVSPCHHCNEILDSRGKLLKHIGDCHEDIPLAFKCSYCPKTFATARGVREHERRSHESRLFLDAEHLVCPHCEQEFQNKRNRDEHVKRHGNPNSVIGRGF
ncbi:hypothetical protein Q1695_013852 [Nippostrongylus brasiliensis]|nr:hypothetical protein Q1695_013852 [Nippostrongylus brasiliensis]